jgi:exopolyphosphatase / guanosine-5'-triphosphate,3'-diphosphate pyrophosphatase
MTTLAAVDMGSNAIRLHICNLLLLPENRYEFKTIEYMRIPLRLGEDVFSTGKLSDGKIDKLVKLGQSLMNIFELYGVHDYISCATSAMREASNSEAVVAKVKQETGFQINVIDGHTEAEWANRGLRNFLGNGVYVHVDVGGGSSEVNIYLDKEKTASASFKVGAVRLLLKENVTPVMNEMTVWVKTNCSKLNTKETPKSLGTGGNITKIHELAGISTKKAIKLETIKETVAYIENFSTEDRINILKLNPDRADVIVPSAGIYTAVMEAAGAEKMFVPKVGLTDGMFEVLREKLLGSK